MSTKGTVSNTSLFLLWAGAAISVAEILTGTLLAPLGTKQALVAIVLGHLLGGSLIYLAAFMGAKQRKSAMESTRYSFGRYGSYGFSVLNILQLIGWTAIMMVQGSRVLDQVTIKAFGYSNTKLWVVVIALGISLWLLLDQKHFSKVNGLVVSALLALCVMMAFKIPHTFSYTGGAVTDGFSFGQGVELNVAMCLSWLPLVGDYTRHAKQESTSSFFVFLGYFLVSSFMFALGLFLSLSSGTDNIGLMLGTLGFGLPSLFLVLFSTVTTTYLDVHSAAQSAENIHNSRLFRTNLLLPCFVGMAIALFLNAEGLEPLLYFIGSVFAPLYAILFTDYFILRRKSSEEKTWDMTNTLLWAGGFLLYRLFMETMANLSNSLVVFVVVGILAIVVRSVESACKR